MEQPRAVSPLVITTTDGQERRLLLTMGGLRRLKERLKKDTLADLLNADAATIGPALIFEALLEKGTLTEDQLADLLPANLPEVVRTVGLLLGASFPETNGHPPTPNPATTTTVQ